MHGVLVVGILLAVIMAFPLALILYFRWMFWLLDRFWG